MVYGDSNIVDKEGKMDKKIFLSRLKEKGYKVIHNTIKYENTIPDDYTETNNTKIKLKLLVIEDDKYRFTLLVNGAEYTNEEIFFELYRSEKGKEYGANDIFLALDEMQYFVRALSILRHEIPEKVETFAKASDKVAG
jgi:hypothetical protein